MIRTIFILSFFFISSQLLAQAQLSTKNKKAIEYYIQADNFRVRGQHQQAVELLRLAIDKDKDFFEAYYRLGLVYMSRDKYAEAIANFEKGLSLTTDPAKQKIFWYDMGDSYFRLGEYDKTAKLFNDFLKVEILNKQKIDHAKQMLLNVEFAKQSALAASKYKLHVLSDTVNHFPMQYFPVLTADQQELIFTRRLDSSLNSDEDIVVSRKNKTGQWTFPVPISSAINTASNDGTCTISADGRLLILTSCLGREGFGSCDLFESRKVGDDWSTPVNLGINVNSAAWESQPTLSADGRTLYFVSDRRGGLGLRDIWVTTKNDKGDWAKAKNIGKQINTIYDEISPFIHVNNKTLYFASNGLTGLGGYDIYYTEKDTAKTWSVPVNIGGPINDHEDQFSLFITADGKKGYYSHEETLATGISSSKIYEVEIPQENQVRYRSNYVKGIIRDRQTKKPLAANVELINIDNDVRESLVKSDSITGSYLIVLTQGADYALYVNKKEYLFESKNFNYSEVKDFNPITLDVALSKIQSGSMVVLNNIFFDIDKYDLKNKSTTELQKIINFLTENPTVRMEISGHTDTTGSVAHNKQLSEKRAQAVYEYLINKGVKSTRLVAKGYGSEHPMASNDTENTRQLNRRIEFKVLQ
jgi:outer membrane protein OmpA-like peptidoglycan-associated protein/tetratricopeptide (TPR) repeat protein